MVESFLSAIGAVFGVLFAFFLIPVVIAALLFAVMAGIMVAAYIIEVFDKDWKWKKNDKLDETKQD